MIIKSFVGTFFLIVITLVSLDMIGIMLAINTASGYASDIEDRIEYSCLSPEVIEECTDEVEELDRDYEITVKVWTTEGMKPYGRMDFSYTINTALLGVNTRLFISRDLAPA